MDKFIIFNGQLDKKEPIKYEYEVGETILVNSTERMMCKKKEIVDGELNQYFVSGRLVFD